MVKPFGFFSKNGKVRPLIGGIGGQTKQIVLPKREIIPEKYKDTSKSYAISFTKKGKEQSKKAAQFAYEKAKKFAEEKKLKEKAKEDIKKDLKSIINFRSKQEEKDLEQILQNEKNITKSAEEIAQELRKLEREKAGKKKFDFEFKNDPNEEVIGGDAQKKVLITNRGNEIPAPDGYYEKPEKKEQTSADKKEVVDAYLNVLPSHKLLMEEGMT